MHSRIARTQEKLYKALQEQNPGAHEAVNGQVRLKAFLDQFSKVVRRVDSIVILQVSCACSSMQELCMFWSDAHLLLALCLCVCT
jgi:hypothetical protein